MTSEVETATGTPGSNGGGERPPEGPSEEERWYHRHGRATRAWLTRSAAGAWLLVLVLLPMGVVTMTVWGGIHRPVAPEEASVALLKAALVACLSYMPGWLYVRFLGRRAGALWNEYVLNLHRLGWDHPRFLPEPPVDSQFHAAWKDTGGDLIDRDRNVYQQKFVAYYGEAVPPAGHGDPIVRTDTMFPVFLATAFISTAWTAVMWDDGFASTPSSTWDVLKYAYLGAYVFMMQSLVRRFFQSDLRPSAYASALLRFIVVLAVTLAVLQLMPPPGPGAAVVAFVVGIFPVVVFQALQRAAAGMLGTVVPTATSDYPLNQIDGLDLWYEARLLEEGIEDMQNLTTANLVDVILHTRVPVSRLVDWVDQAHLYLHLDRAERGVKERRRVDKALRAESSGTTDIGGTTGAEDAGPEGAGTAEVVVPELVKGSVSVTSRAGTQTRLALRQLGIRTATDLLKAYPSDSLKATCAGGEECHICLPCELRRVALDPFQIRTIVGVLSQEPGLAPVWNWQANGVVRHC